jgi:hypothetical protein
MTGWRRDIRDVFLLLDKVGGGVVVQLTLNVVCFSIVQCNTAV